MSCFILSYQALSCSHDTSCFMRFDHHKVELPQLYSKTVMSLFILFSRKLIEQYVIHGKGFPLPSTGIPSLKLSNHPITFRFPSVLRQYKEYKFSFFSRYITTAA